MDGHCTRPNQWNPETDEDNAAFDRIMLRRAKMTMEEWEAKRREALLPETIPEGADRLTELGICFRNFLREHERKHPSPLKEHTPDDAREYCRRRGYVV